MIETVASPALSPVTARKEAVGKRLNRAVRRNSLLSASGLSEYVFSRLFRNLVYAQIWEDPDVDMAALKIEPGNTIVTIASGGVIPNIHSVLLPKKTKLATGKPGSGSAAL